MVRVGWKTSRSDSTLSLPGRLLRMHKPTEAPSKASATRGRSLVVGIRAGLKCVMTHAATLTQKRLYMYLYTCTEECPTGSPTTRDRDRGPGPVPVPPPHRWYRCPGPGTGTGTGVGTGPGDRYTAGCLNTR